MKKTIMLIILCLGVFLAACGNRNDDSLNGELQEDTDNAFSTDSELTGLYSLSDEELKVGRVDVVEKLRIIGFSEKQAVDFSKKFLEGTLYTPEDYDRSLEDYQRLYAAEDCYMVVSYVGGELCEYWYYHVDDDTPFVSSSWKLKRLEEPVTDLYFGEHGQADSGTYYFNYEQEDTSWSIYHEKEMDNYRVLIYIDEDIFVRLTEKITPGEGSSYKVSYGMSCYERVSTKVR